MTFVLFWSRTETFKFEFEHSTKHTSRVSTLRLKWQEECHGRFYKALRHIMNSLQKTSLNSFINNGVFIDHASTWSWCSPVYIHIILSSHQYHIILLLIAVSWHRSLRIGIIPLVELTRRKNKPPHWFPTWASDSDRSPRPFYFLSRTKEELIITNYQNKYSKQISSITTVNTQLWATEGTVPLSVHFVVYLH